MHKGQFEVKGRYRHLVCVLTGTHHQEEVIEQALHVARNHQAEISMLLALDELPPNAQMIMQSVSYLESTEAMEVMAKHWLDDQVSSWDTEIPINASVTFGSQTANIIALVEKTQADLVIKQADDDVLERWFGNDDVNLLRQCPCPVWITHQGQAEKYKTIVAAVDLNYHYAPDVVAQKRALNMEILRHATRIALLEFAQLHIVHVYDVVPESILRDGFIQFDQPALQEEKALIAQERQTVLDELMAMLASEVEDATLTFLRPTTTLIEGEPAIKLGQFVKQADADLLVMGTAGRKGVAGLLLGNTTESVIHQVECALVAVKTP